MTESPAWQRAEIAQPNTHHLLGGAPLYADRFDEVLAFHSPGLAAVRRAGSAWHIDVHGGPAYNARFERAFGFYEGRASVIGKDGWHHLLPDGRSLYDARYDWCGNYQHARCTVRDRERRYVHLGLDGQPAYAQRWRYAGDFREGAAVAQSDEGLSTHINPAGALLHGRWFVDLGVFHKGLATARDERGWMHVDRSGKPAYPRRFLVVEPFYNGQARVERVDGGLELIAETGESLVELRSARSLGTFNE